MGNCLHNDRFAFEYLESYVDNTVLWEQHCHALYELITVLEGEITIAVEGRLYHLRLDQTIIIPPLCYHTVETNRKCLYRRVTVMFDRSAIPEVLRGHFPENHMEIPVFYCHSLSGLREICLSEQPAFYEPLAESLMIRAFYDSIQGEHISHSDEVDKWLEKLISYIDEHLCEKILLSDLAACIPQSKSSVCHIFQRKMNISPKQYILQKRMALANKLIRDGMSVTAAAKRVGYENYSNFYRMYRKHFGTVDSDR
ncbi:MAG: helix-turn-helix domain-containing protein [Clostridia bacterium]|nr:helix-turn-helix domain-containing protein [Clostridia bacterium]